jgi:hypothetical protein
MLRGVEPLRFKFTLTMAAYDLIRLPKLLGAAGSSKMKSTSAKPAITGHRWSETAGHHAPSE